MTGRSGVPSRSMRQYSKMKLPLPSRRGGQPTKMPVFGSRVKRRSVGPSCRSKAPDAIGAHGPLVPIGLAGFNGWHAFSSMPVPSSYSVTEKVLLLLPGETLVPVQPSEPNSGTLIQRTRKALTLAKPSACTGNDVRFTDRADGLRSAQAGAILGRPARNSGTVGVLSASPAPKVMLPFEFKKNPFHTQVAVVPTKPLKRNSKPPAFAPATGGPAPPAPSL